MVRPYDQYCALAVSLDLVGDRWSLLVIRELLAGPRRYGELLHGIPGIPTDMLAARLRQLESAGLVEVASFSGDNRARAYGLTDDGRGLEESVLALARFGMGRLPNDDSKRSFRAHWLRLAVRALFRPGAIDEEIRVRFVSGDHQWQARLGPSAVVDDGDGDSEPDVTIRGTPSALLACVQDPASAKKLVESGAVAITGTRADVRRLNRALRQTA